jgi:uncharacterized Fe-S cluster-containing MiaB family protein
MAQGQPPGDPPPSPHGHTIEQIAEALRNHNGIVSTAAKALKVSRQAIDRRISNSATLKAVVIEARSDVVDLAETKLIELIQAGDVRAILFTLRTLGRDRGWAETVDVNVLIEREREKVRDDAIDRGLDPNQAVAEFERIVAENRRRQ